MSKLPPEKPDLQKQKKSPKSSTPEADALGSLLHMLQPLMDFHKTVEGANDNDLRMYWDVRVIRGANETFMTSVGSSSLPGALSEKLRGNASSLIQQEVYEKISVPLVGEMQTIVENGALEGAKRLVRLTNYSPADDTPVVGRLTHDAQAIDEQA